MKYGEYCEVGRNGRGEVEEVDWNQIQIDFVFHAQELAGQMLDFIGWADVGLYFGDLASQLHILKKFNRAILRTSHCAFNPHAPLQESRTLHQVPKRWLIPGFNPRGLFEYLGKGRK